MVVESIAAGIVAVALLWLVLQPIFLPDAVVAVPVDRPDPEETPRGRALLALKEIEFDRATGKLSAADYASLNARYSAVAVATLEPAESPSVRGLRCRVHGVRAEVDARFCAVCGAGLLTAAGHCARCDTAVPADARFCPGCGTPIVS